MAEQTIWTEKYKPNNLDDFIGSENDFVKAKIAEYIEQDEIPLLLFEGHPGTGKSTLADILKNSLNCEYKEWNASDDRGMDLIRENIKPFISTGSLKKWKIVILEEADKLTPDAQDALKDLMLKKIKRVRYILTCNNVNLLNDALLSRFSLGTYTIIPLNKTDVAKYLVNILNLEKVKYELKDIAYIINKTYPDIRKTINITQKYVTANKVLKLDSMSLDEISLMKDIVTELSTFKSFDKSFVKIRQLIANSKMTVYLPLIEYLYEHLDKFAKTPVLVATIIMILNDTQKSEKSIPDKEINIMSMMSELLNALQD